MDSADGYRELYRRLTGDDLPRFRRQFKTYLNQNTIRDIAGFQSQLNKQAELIRERIATINSSLVGVDYNPGRYIRLEPLASPHADIRDFRADLRACTDDAVSGEDSDHYSEQKFLQVSRIIERFRGREGMTEADRRWTRFVTDVRNWYTFAASERYREDDTEYEHYADSGGKSGGQKEKLAYTILAASLAYQFKLEWGAAKSRTFRFAVIDEAFGRGSDESTRFALELFGRLGLQLLIVTPLQKIHVIEPYVSAVGFVDNPQSNNSRLQTLTIGEYQARRAAHQIAQQIVFSESLAGTAGPAAASGAGAAVTQALASDRGRGRVCVAGTGPAGGPGLADVRTAIKKRWDSGALLARFAAGQDWEPLGIPIRGPSARQIGEHLTEVREWAAEWAEAARGPLRVEYKQVGGRHFGANSIPGRAWLDGYDDTWALLKANPDVRRLTELIEAARGTRLVPWLTVHPLRALRLADAWDRLLATVRWIEQRQVPGMYLRQVDVPGVDTKFIERHKGVLTELLDAQLDPARVAAGASGFAGRYGFLRRPGYVRFRVAGGFHGFCEMSVRTGELTAPPEGVTRAYVIENEITYLAFPLPVAAMAILGGGYAVPVLEPLGWLAGLGVVYWGDIDTHGFAILNRLRHYLPRARSMLMDRATLLDHRDHWVTEPSQTTVALDRLDQAESAVYADLISNAHAPSVRLEQERISFSAIEGAVAAH